MFIPGSNNSIPIKTGRVGSALVTAACTTSDGTGTIGTDTFLAFTAGSNGSYVDRLRWIPIATAPTTTGATVARVYISSVSTGATTSANTFLFQEVSLAAVAADNASNAGNIFDIGLGFSLPAGWTILVQNHAAPVALSAWRATVIGGDY